MVNGVGKGGGLALFWDESLKVELKSYNMRHIDVIITEPEGARWTATFVYGEPKAQNRHEMWNLLRRIRLNASDPWLMIGDFNEAMWQIEHRSRVKHSERQMRDFREVLVECDLQDIGFQGVPWTYDNNQASPNNVKVRLDRAVASPVWRAMFDQANIMHLTTACSDHVPLLLKKGGNMQQRRRSKINCFEAVWERVKSFNSIEHESWDDGGLAKNLGDVRTKLAYTMENLKRWSRDKIGNIKKSIERCRRELEEMRMRGREDSEPDVHRLKIFLQELLHREEIWWKQRSRITWLKEGDRNTRYFHLKASWRARKNLIKKLRRSDGMMCSKEEELGEIARSFFRDLYTKDESLNPGELLNMFEPKITDEMNGMLTKPFTDEEISDALFQIGPLKAPGPDGFPARFFQRNWGVLKRDVIEGVREFFETGEWKEGMNDTVIVMIPKTNAPVEMKDFRPVSLCNVIYKVVAKCLVNRLRPLLQEIISETQSAFVPGRMITDNALVAFECFHSIHKCTRESQDFCALKLDLSKAYDRVDWGFLDGALQKLGFGNIWRKWIMSCVTSVRYSVRLNGNMLEPFYPTRGLREGDPLNPYLFLFIADGLSNILQRRRDERQIQPLKVCRSAPGVSHLLFADDSLLFFKAEVIQATRIKEALDLYERCTGQLINPKECSLLFSALCPQERQDGIKAVLQVERTCFDDKCLGLPTPDGRMKAEQFQPIKERFEKRLTDWSERFLSLAGKEALIKSVAQALPTYTMGVFKMPERFCEEYEQLVRNFWWGHEKGEKKVHWIAWEKLTSPKLLGGLGFRDIRCFNQALLARQAWRLIESPDSLCARVLKAKYYPNGTITDTAFPSVSSPTWKGIVHGLELLKKGLIWRIGDGSKTKIWRNHWVAHGENLKILEKKTWNRLIYVRELIVTDTKTWNEPLIRHIIREEDADEILKIRIPQREEEDFPAWHYEKTGIFSVRSVYRLAWNLARKTSEQASSSSGGADGRKIWDNVWKANVQPKVRVFAWKLAQDRLATWENKKKRKIEMFGTCPICGQKEETGFHATVECTLAKALRASLREHWTLPDESLFSMTGPDWLLVLLDRLSSEKKAQVLYLLWRA